MKLRKKSSYILLLIIGIAFAFIMVEKGVTYRGLLAGSVLCVVTLLLAFHEGTFGMWLAVFLNMGGMIASFSLYSQSNNIEALIIASFQFGIGMACLIIGHQTNNQNKHQSKLIEVASIDTTTDTYTMNKFHEMYGQLIEHDDDHSRISFIIIGLDDFNTMNQKFGYSMTESLLKKVTSIVKWTIDEDAVVYRLGMSELLVAYLNQPRIDLITEGESIRQEIIDNQALLGELAIANNLSVSIGIGSYPETSSDIKDLLNDTYAALRYSKNRGKNNVKVYTDVFNDLDNLLNNDRELEIAVKMILLTVKHKDSYTYDHSIRVADYVYDFAIRLGIESFVAEKYKIAALLHDVGKINVSAIILNKEGRLTKEEFEQIKQHTRLGSDLSSYSSTIANYGNIVLYHHERFDGHGYPEGLSGDEIPFGARIIAIADAVDAMVSQRPYQKARSVGEAIDELEKCAGSQFDPSLVPEFVKLLEERMSATTETLDVTVNYPREVGIRLKVAQYEQSGDLCEYHPTCPIYSDKFKLKEGVADLYIKKYCTRDYNHCSRFMVTKNVGKEQVTDYLMPNMTKKANELIGMTIGKMRS